MMPQAPGRSPKSFASETASRELIAPPNPKNAARSSEPRSRTGRARRLCFYCDTTAICAAPTCFLGGMGRSAGGAVAAAGS